MIDVTLSIVALIAGGFTLELFAAGRAPLSEDANQGFADQDFYAGFEEYQSGNPS
jgi:hypothetical protein